MSLIDDINNLDPQNPGAWPLPFQLVFIAIIFAGILFAGYKLDWSDQYVELEQAQAKEQEHKQTFENKQKKAANLEALKEQMKEMQQSFGDMLRQLPNKTEVAGLIVDISQEGLSAGLEFELFQPKSETLTEYYAELPINIRVVGTYHQFGEFISGVAALPRIVTTHNINISRGNGGLLTMTAIVKTYRALEEEEGG